MITDKRAVQKTPPSMMANVATMAMQMNTGRKTALYMRLSSDDGYSGSSTKGKSSNPHSPSPYFTIRCNPCRNRRTKGR